MSLAAIHWPAVLVATFAAFVTGAICFGPKTFFPIWWKAMGRSPDEKPGTGLHMGVVFGSTFAGQFAQAVTLSLLVQTARQAAGTEAFGAGDGALTGLLAGAGIAAASSLSHRLFAGHGFKVWALEVGGDVLGLVIMGAILGGWR